MRKFEKISYEEFKKTFNDNEELYNSYSLPKRKTNHSAGYDIASLIDYNLVPGDSVVIPTGIKFIAPEDEVLLLFNRSSLGFKHNIRLVNQVGVIDTDYYNNPDNEGHILVKLKNEGDHDFHIEVGTCIAQGMFTKYLVVDDEEEINNTRKGGIGSTNGEEKMTVYEDLIWRGLIKDISYSKDLEEKINKGGLTFYIGTDPTADSLHIGHLSSFLISKRLANAGHNPILLIGGGTGLIGDPRPTVERDTIVKDELLKNADSLTKQVKDLFGFKVVNNYDWIKDINLIDYLRDYGKFFNVNYMINKDIIRRRLETGITYCELSYMILQSLDFLHLHNTQGCDLQVAGSDQWGNITSGIDLIRKKTGDEVYGFTMPLVLDKYGNKFGKSEGNALWLDKEKTSSYDIYQYLVNSDDTLVISYLKVFTFLSREEIESLEESTKTNPEQRLAQKALAFEVVKFLHGEEEANKAKELSEKVFSGEVVVDMPTKEVTDSNIVNILVETSLCPSKSEARRLITQGGIVVDKEKITDPDYICPKEFILHKGKKNIIKIIQK